MQRTRFQPPQRPPPSPMRLPVSTAVAPPRRTPLRQSVPSVACQQAQSRIDRRSTPHQGPKAVAGEGRKGRGAREEAQVKRRNGRGASEGATLVVEGSGEAEREWLFARRVSARLALRVRDHLAPFRGVLTGCTRCACRAHAAVQEGTFITRVSVLLLLRCGRR